MREVDLLNLPGIAEAMDRAVVPHVLCARELDPERRPRPWARS